MSSESIPWRPGKADEAGPRRRAGGGGKKMGEQEDQQAAYRALSQARNDMGQTLGHFQEVQQRLNDTSQTFDATKRQYDDFDFKMKSASQLLGQLKRRTEQDSKYIWWSFCFFLSVVAYIVLKRMRVFRMVHFGASWTYWTGSVAADLVQTFASFLSGQTGLEPTGFDLGSAGPGLGSTGPGLGSNLDPVGLGLELGDPA